MATGMLLSEAGVKRGNIGHLGDLIIDKNSPEKYTAVMSMYTFCRGTTRVPGLLLGGV